MSIPIAILCGGYGTRSGQPINKCFVEVAGKPFLLWTLDQMEQQGYSTFVLCRGTGGTLTALRNARDQLGEKFLVAYGDTYLSTDLRDFVQKWETSKAPSITAIYDKIDAGINGFYTHTLDMLDDDVTDLKVLQKELKARMMTCHYDAPVPYYNVDTPAALAETRRAFSCGC